MYHLRFYYRLPDPSTASLGFFLIDPSKMVFIDVLLTLLLAIELTFGNLTPKPKLSDLRIPFPLLFMMAVLLVGGWGLLGWLDGILVLLLRIFLLSLFFSCMLSYLVFSSLAFSANLKATVLAILRICWCLLFKHPKKLIFFNPFLILLLFLYIKSNPPICSYYPVSLYIFGHTIFQYW